ncbi:MAG: C40 family peptidase [Halothiobacillus sp.]|jgi:murein DD-endopeptidase|nr:C40 family peptidase [Halothiobacillus sp.]
MKSGTGLMANPRLRRTAAVGAVLSAALGLGGCASMPTDTSGSGSNSVASWFDFNSDSSSLANNDQTNAKGHLSAKLPEAPLKSLAGYSGDRTAATEAIIQAMSQLGTAYQWGGASIGSGFDCSGLTSYVYKKADISLPRTARDQYAFTARIGKSQLRPGDLLFFKIRSRKIDHVGIYVGNNRFIHAPRAGEHVKYAKLNDAYWRRHFAGAGRVPGAAKIDLADLNLQ